MARKIWIWIKRIIIGLAVVAAAGAAAIMLYILTDRYRISQLNRTQESALKIDPNDLVLESAHRLLAKLHPVASGNSLKFVVMPSFGKRWFAIVIAEHDGKGAGEAIVETQEGQLLSHRMFEMPKSDLLRFLERWDKMTDGYAGEGRLLTDGNPVAFERQRGERLTSGEGNSPCHYDALGDWAAQKLARYVPELQDLRNPELDVVLRSEFCNRSIFALR